jgi:cobalt-zinc-cadmium efflux system outer membrane protein
VIARIFLVFLVLGLLRSRCAAQVTLADDIIMAAQGKENAERRRDTELGRSPGTAASPFRRRPGSNDILLGIDPARRVAPLPGLTRRPANPEAIMLPAAEPLEREHGLAPAIERLRLPQVPPAGRPGSFESPTDDHLDDGPPDGLTLDAAIDHLVRFSPALRVKYMEIPQAEADVLTAGLRANPLVFYSSDGIPYGSYSPQRPGTINHGISLVYPFDYSGKRKARMALAQCEKRVLEAQYQNAVRLEIDNLYTAYVDAMATRQAVRAAERSLGLIDQTLRNAQTRPTRTPAERESLDDLIIERDITAMSVGDERDRDLKARQRLGGLLGVPPEQIEQMQLHGTLRVLGPNLPPAETLVYVALGHRPDLAAHRLGIERARAALVQERAERFSDAYLLYSPFEYHDNGTQTLQGSTSWGAGLFVSLPLFNRNQGNVIRARLNVEQSHQETAALEREVAAEVRQAARDFANTFGDLQRLEQVTLPAVRRKRDRSRTRLDRGEIPVADYLALQRDTTSLVRYYRDTLARHRRNTLRINTVLGMRLLP